MAKNSNEEAIIFKIITIGDSNVGKTSIINRYIDNRFIENTLMTIGMSKSQKEIVLNNGQKIILNLTDTAGQEKYKAMNRQYLKNIDGVLFVFDLSEIKTFNNIKMWMNFFNDNYTGKDNIPKYLIGNKKDLLKEVDQDKIDIFLEDNQDFFCKYKQTAAKEEDNQISELFQEMGELLYEVNKNNIRKKSKNIKLSSLKKEKKTCFIVKCLV